MFETSPEASFVRRWPLRLLLIASLGVATWALVADRDRLGDALARVTWPAIALAFMSGVFAVGCMFAGWATMVSDSAVELSLKDALKVYAVGQVGKYLPGAIWPVLTQARLARRHRAQPLRVAAGSLVALAVSLCVGLAMGSALLPFTTAEAVHKLWWSPLVCVPFLLALRPRALNRMVNWAARMLRRPDVDFAYRYRAIGASAAWCVVGNIMFGLHIYVLAATIGPSGPRAFVLSVCAYALASCTGVLIVFLPAGAGAREAVLVVVLSPVLSVHAGLAVALVSRAVLLVVDFLLAGSQVRSSGRLAPERGGPTVPLIHAQDDVDTSTEPTA